MQAELDVTSVADGTFSEGKRCRDIDNWVGLTGLEDEQLQLSGKATRAQARKKNDPPHHRRSVALGNRYTFSPSPVIRIM